MQKQPKSINIKFKKDSTFVPSRALAKKLCQTDKWLLDMGKYKSQNCKKMFEDALQAYVLRMWIGFNDNPNIIKEISHTHFNNLVEVWLTKNKIQSLDLLCTIYMPNLEELYLRQNRIVSIKPMRKCNFPKVQVINVYGNFITEFDCLFQLNAPSLNTFYLEYQNKDHIQSQSLNWIAKMHTNQLKFLCCVSPSRIRQDTIVSALIRKNQNRLKVHYDDQQGD